MVRVRVSVRNRVSIRFTVRVWFRDFGFFSQFYSKLLPATLQLMYKQSGTHKLYVS